MKGTKHMGQYNLVGDIGATNARFSVVKVGTSDLENIRYLPCTEFANFQEAASAYLSEFAGINIGSACFAIAGAVHSESFKLANNHWHINKNDVTSALNDIPIHWLNDFSAQALATTALPPNDLRVVNAGCMRPERQRLAIGAGTGLGVCGLLKSSNGWVTTPGEGGHVDFSPNSELQFKVLIHLQKKYGHVSVERILSGPGILNLYQALAEIRGQEAKFKTPAEITRAATSSNADQLSYDTLQLFCQIFGRVAGDAALNMGALGGVYITGGVIRNFLDLFLASNFKKCFEDKGRLQGYMSDIPIFISTTRYMGLLGAVQAINNPAQ
jgi:glucokinase